MPKRTRNEVNKIIENLNGELRKKFDSYRNRSIIEDFFDGYFKEFMEEGSSAEEAFERFDKMLADIDVAMRDTLFSPVAIVKKEHYEDMPDFLENNSEAAALIENEINKLSTLKGHAVTAADIQKIKDQFNIIKANPLLYRILLEKINLRIGRIDILISRLIDEKHKEEQISYVESAAKKLLTEGGRMFNPKLDISVGGWHNNCGFNCLAYIIKQYLRNNLINDELLKSKEYKELLGCFNVYYSTNLDWKTLKEFLINKDQVELEVIFAPVIRSFSKIALKNIEGISMFSAQRLEQLSNMDNQLMSDISEIGYMLSYLGFSSEFYSTNNFVSWDVIPIQIAYMRKQDPNIATVKIGHGGSHWHVEAKSEEELQEFHDELNLKYTKKLGAISNGDGGVCELLRNARYHLVNRVDLLDKAIKSGVFSGENDLPVRDAIRFAKSSIDQFIQEHASTKKRKIEDIEDDNDDARVKRTVQSSSSFSMLVNKVYEDVTEHFDQLDDHLKKYVSGIFEIYRKYNNKEFFNKIANEISLFEFSSVALKSIEGSMRSIIELDDVKIKRLTQLKASLLNLVTDGTRRRLFVEQTVEKTNPIYKWCSRDGSSRYFRPKVISGADGACALATIYAICGTNETGKEARAKAVQQLRDNIHNEAVKNLVKSELKGGLILPAELAYLKSFEFKLTSDEEQLIKNYIECRNAFITKGEQLKKECFGDNLPEPVAAIYLSKKVMSYAELFISEEFAELFKDKKVIGTIKNIDLIDKRILSMLSTKVDEASVALDHFVDTKVLDYINHVVATSGFWLGVAGQSPGVMGAVAQINGINFRVFSKNGNADEMDIVCEHNSNPIGGVVHNIHLQAAIGNVPGVQRSSWHFELLNEIPKATVEDYVECSALPFVPSFSASVAAIPSLKIADKVYADVTKTFNQLEDYHKKFLSGIFKIYKDRNNKEFFNEVSNQIRLLKSSSVELNSIGLSMESIMQLDDTKTSALSLLKEDLLDFITTTMQSQPQLKKTCNPKPSI